MSIAIGAWPRPHRFTVAEYHRMGEVGLLPSHVKVELLEGVIYEWDPIDPPEMPPIERLHSALVNQLNSRLVRAVGERAIVQCQGRLPLGAFSEARPEFAVLARREDFYRHTDPSVGDTLLIIEVCGFTLPFESPKKMPLYALHGVPEVWEVDAHGKRLLAYRNPVGAEYRELATLAVPGAMPIASLPGVVVDLSPIF